MAKGQKRSNRETKKPKQSKPERSGAPAVALVTGPGARAPVGSRNPDSAHKGRR